MRNKWKTLKFGNVFVEIIDGDRGVNYPKQGEFGEAGHCLFLNTGNVTVDGFDFTDCSFVSKEKDRALRKGKLQRDDVVLTTRGTVGNVAFYDCSVPYEHIRINSGMVILRPNQEEVFPRYLYLFVRSRIFKNQVASLSTGSAQPQFPIRDIQRIEMLLPPLPEQRAIAHVLGTLDDKIELNRRMNETLEAMAQALFKSWFVDAIQNGLPAGWHESTVDEICEFAYGKALKEETRKSGPIPVYGSNGQVGWHNEALVKGPGIVVGRKGNPGIVTWAPRDFFPIDTTFYVVPKDKCRSLYFLFFTLRALDLASLSADSAVPGLNRNMAYMSEIVAPPQSLLSAFDDKVRPLFERIHSNNEESRTIASLRDALLPKLLSGTMRVQSAGALTV